MSDIPARDDDQSIDRIKSEWYWRGKTEQQIKDLQRTGDETRKSVDGLGTKIEKLQLALQSQVTKMVMISGLVIWVGSIVTTIVAGYIMKVFGK